MRRREFLRLWDNEIDHLFFKTSDFIFNDDCITITGILNLNIAICPECGRASSKIHQIHGNNPRWLRDLDIFNKPCFIEFPRRRFYCECCDKPFTEYLSFAGFRQRYTYRYEQYIFNRCKNCDFKTISKLEKLGYHAVKDIYYRLCKEQEAQQQHDESVVAIIGIDEISMKKRHKQFILIISDLNRKCVIDVLPNREKVTLSNWFNRLSEERKKQIRIVSIDMWAPYLQAINQQLPHAEVVVDRFHVMKNLNDSVSKTRRMLQNQATDEQQQQLKGLRWVLLKNEEKLSDKEQQKLDLMYEVSPELKSCHQLKEQFRQIFEQGKNGQITNPKQAKLAFDKWEANVRKSQLENLIKFLDTLNNWKPYILNYFLENYPCVTNGFVEGTNNKLKLIMRRGFGFTNFDNFRFRIINH